jgi:GNAT superfamily N-acetyltransferase
LEVDVENVSPDIRIWVATEADLNFCLYLCKKFRDHEFFFVPDYAMRREIAIGNIIAFDYGALEAGYIWVTFPRNGRSRINQLAVDEQLWRNHVGTQVVAFYESLAKKNGCWSVYLSCNTNTPGNKFWPTVGYSTIVSKQAGRRGGLNLIWAKVISTDGMLFEPHVSEVKTADSYRFQSSISASKKMVMQDSHEVQLEIFDK